VKPRRRGSAAPPAVIELLCVGTELLSGRVNTHQSYLALKLKEQGLSISRETSLPDDPDAISQEVREALGRCQALIVCGGLGPTFDDVTREAVSAALGRPLRYRPGLYAEIRRKFARHGIPIPEENRRQAFVIEGARVLSNRFGSAPGQLLRLRSRGGASRTVVLLPGPFSELAPMFERDVLPTLRRAHARGVHAEHVAVHLSGIAESAADEKLSHLTAKPRAGESFTILASTGQVDFHATASAPSRAAARRLIKRLRRRVYDAVGKHVFGEGTQTLESAAGDALRSRGLTLALAESCTAGMVAARLTAIPGSSDYFKGGAVAYSNELKSSLLRVRAETLARHGAVSSHCAR
jgi:nicotinamide-nucleotide amidase